MRRSHLSALFVAGLRQGYRLWGLLRGNVIYVASTILMEGDKVLLIQEAASRMRGLWYLPAGLVDPGETIVVRLLGNF